MFSLLQIELYKIFKKPRTYIAFGVITLIIILVQVAFVYGGKEYVGLIVSGLGGSFELSVDKTLNGYFVCYYVLNLLLIHVPILVALVAGDIVAGEANMGTLRLVVSKPITRTKLLLVKFAASCIYTLMLLMWMAIFALWLSIVLFGKNDLFIARELESNIISSSDVLWRYGAAFVFAALGLIMVAAMAFMFSMFADNSVGPIVGTVCVVIVFTVLTQMQIPFYDETIKPYLFTTHMLGWKGFFYVKGADGVTINGSIEDISQIIKSAFILVAYTLVFLLIGGWYFNKKNILS
jgi:ABC-2 type transport system permease protein